ncbi:hypothetical protein [Pararhizobium gei]|uniref:hypothetical protein n=1 Tax=Pararhizobium gei TaxID=1395951 RepID=UPI0023DCBFC9|nr:hypothetical protein [Rhizobium gei]
MLERSVAARRFVIQTLDRLMAQSSSGASFSAAADRRDLHSSGVDLLFSSMRTGSKN